MIRKVRYKVRYDKVSYKVRLVIIRKVRYKVR